MNTTGIETTGRHQAAAVPAAGPRTRQAGRVAVTALAIGALGDAVLRVEPPGVNVTVWLIAIVTGVMVLRMAAREAEQQDWWLAIAAGFFATTFSWRDTDALYPLNFLAIVLALSLLAFTGTGSPRFRVDRAGLREYVRAVLHAGLSAIGGAILLFASDLKPRAGAPSVWDRFGGDRSRAIARGALIAVPLLLAFGGLLMSADPVFHRIVTRVLSIETLLWHAFFTALFAWFAGGYLRGALVAREPVGLHERPLAFTLGLTETSIVLGTLNILFAAFVLVQFRYLFGGSALVLTQEGMTFAEYARRGFFELVFVSALVLPLLLLLHELLDRGATGSEQRFRWLARLMLALVFIVMLSALQRMRLYQRAYGLTESRLYATAFMLWLAIVFGGFAATILRGRPRFAVGALISGLLVLAGLNVLNPSAFIVRTNVARAAEAEKLDVAYLSTLGADAVPALAESLDRFPADAQCSVARRLLSRWGTPDDRRQAGERWAWQGDGESRDWRTANLARAHAQRAVRRHNDELRSALCVVRPAAGSATVRDGWWGIAPPAPGSAEGDAESGRALPIDAPTASSVESVMGTLYQFLDVSSHTRPVSSTASPRFDSLAYVSIAGATPGEWRSLSVHDLHALKQRSSGDALLRTRGTDVSETDRTVERRGALVLVRSRYESRYADNGEVYARGTNLIGLLHDARGWRIVSLVQSPSSLPVTASDVSSGASRDASVSRPSDPRATRASGTVP